MFRPLLAAFFALLLGLWLIICNIIQAFSLLFVPVYPRFTKQINRGVCWSFFGFLSFTLESILGVEILQTGDALSQSENVFLVANHQAMADIPVVVTVAKRQHRQQDVKWFVKDPLKWVPGVGWGMLFMDCVFVKRNWAADKAKVLATFDRLRHSEFPFWVISFLEGTRMKPEKLAKSQAFAIRHGLPPLQHLLLPRTKGFEATLSGLEGRVNSIYDCTIAYDGPAPNLMQLFLHTKKIHVHVRRFPVSGLPADDKGRGNWANELYRQKDQLLATYLKTGSFQGRFGK
ncbi:MAG: lysophospholipid acyltransferase family protein [Bdellovibrionota bacterium]